MGKGNRTKKDRAASVLAGTNNRKKASQKRSMPTWAGTLIVVLVLAMLIAFSAFSIMNSRGVFLRNKVIVNTANYEITVPMMSYLVYTEYQNWVSNYKDSGYMQYIKGEGGTGLNTSLPLRDQNYSVVTNKDTGATEVTTWFDKFASTALASAKKVLVLCEQARHYGVELGEEEYANIDSAIAMMELYASYYGYSASGYITSMYGKGVTEKDVRAMMELSELATKFSKVKNEEFQNGATPVRVNKYYEENKDDFEVYVDYIGYTFTTSFKAVTEGEDAAAKNAEAYAKYEAEQKKYSERVDALKACTTAKEFSDKLYEFLLEDETAKGTTNPELVALNGQSDAHHYYYKKEDDSSDFEKWVYSSETPVKAGDTNAFKDEDDGYENDSGEYSNVTSEYSAYLILKEVRRDDAKVQNAGHILFKTDTFKDMKDTSKLTGKTKELAQKILDRGETISAEAMSKELLALMFAEGKITEQVSAEGRKYYIIDKEAFKEYGETYTEDGNVFYEEVGRGDMVAEFEDWLYDGVRVQNEISYTGAVKTTYGYHIMFYNGACEEENWFVDVRDALVEADYEAWYTAVSAEAVCPITENAHHWNKIDG